MDWSYGLLAEPERLAPEPPLGLCRRLDAGGRRAGLRGRRDRRGAGSRNCSSGWWTGPWSSWRAAGRARPATGCWRRSGSTAASGWRPRPRRPPSVAGIIDWALAWARDADARLLSAAQAQALARLEQEQDNLRAALEWAADEDDGPCRGAAAGVGPVALLVLPGASERGPRTPDSCRGAFARDCAGRAAGGARPCADRPGRLRLLSRGPGGRGGAVRAESGAGPRGRRSLVGRRLPERPGHPRLPGWGL